MQYKTVQQHQRLGIEVLQGCNLMQLTDQQVQEFKKSLWEHGVIVVRQQHLTASQLKEFAQQTFGYSRLGRQQPKPNDPEIDPNLLSPGVHILGNPKGHTQEIVGKFAWQWHHDKDHLPKTEGLDMNALYVVMLYGVEIPQGVDGQPHTTEFLDMIEAYNNFEPEHQRQLESMNMYHLSPVFSESESDVPMKVHPIVSTHKVTGHKGLYLGSDTSIPVGMEEKPESAKQFWQELFETVLDRTPVFAHVWQPGDIVFWDNSQVMHTGTPYDATQYKRVALRLGVVDNTYV
ncbi:MAG: TauD/TfdA family dioxygenase [Brasilonema octagenarum HA4186-MV1]|jgi:taurine dioxygenase|uniref:TauD/TfdA family dioxygenase n=1 Tax=Brasilonema sennae CENA114 TaxID=415709 RepID=A0A856MJ72_9CYAN|nr:TauD/TfdA family dioxygenase [Brasilonema sennae]MBW4625712.1 TauD/TfdA family dioxygenase [Brasilonema octagenarum HA4186-MV1]QDL11343.1 TauD/TfdA family dioxygenase [Brasilonema sennae CENA114]QDL17684.1 TauD/TfdA family dioxygenase [Brasilonema octagenarum UFV-E1]